MILPTVHYCFSHYHASELKITDTTSANGDLPTLLTTSNHSLNQAHNQLRDPITANMVSDKILEVSHDTNKVPSAKAVTIAYQSTTNRDPLRILLRDMCMYHSRTLPTGGHVPWPVEFH